MRNLSIPEGISKDPDYWASSEKAGNTGKGVPEMSLDMRALMASICLLYEDYPERHCFTDEEVRSHVPETLEKYPFLKALQ